MIDMKNKFFYNLKTRLFHNTLYHYYTLGILKGILDYNASHLKCVFVSLLGGS